MSATYTAWTGASQALPIRSPSSTAARFLSDPSVATRIFVNSPVIIISPQYFPVFDHLSLFPDTSCGSAPARGVSALRPVGLVDVHLPRMAQSTADITEIAAPM